MIDALKCQTFEVEYKKNAFSMNHFGKKNFFFFIGFYFLENFRRN